MFEEMTNEELMELDGGAWWQWVLGAGVVVTIAAAAVAITCLSGGTAAPAAGAGATQLSAEFLTFMGVAAL